MSLFCSLSSALRLIVQRNKEHSDRQQYISNIEHRKDTDMYPVSDRSDSNAVINIS